MFDFTVNYLFITAALYINQNYSYKDKNGLIAYEANVYYMMMRKNNTDVFTEFRGMGF